MRLDSINTFNTKNSTNFKARLLSKNTVSLGSTIQNINLYSLNTLSDAAFAKQMLKSIDLRKDI